MDICNSLVRYLQRVRDICTQYGVIMVCDETITAFGRLGEYVLSRPTPPLPVHGMTFVAGTLRPRVTALCPTSSRAARA